MAAIPGLASSPEFSLHSMTALAKVLQLRLIQGLLTLDLPELCAA